MIPFENHPGYVGIFTRNQADEAILNGSTIVKRNSEPEDITKDGTVGTVLGSIDCGKMAPEIIAKFNARFMYWVEWSDKPKVAVAIVDYKIEQAT